MTIVPEVMDTRLVPLAPLLLAPGPAWRQRPAIGQRPHHRSATSKKEAPRHNW